MVIPQFADRRSLVRLGAMGLAAVVTVLAFSAFVGAYAPPSSAVLVEPSARVFRDGAYVGLKGIPFIYSAADWDQFHPGLYRVETTLRLPQTAISSPVLILPFSAGNAFSVSLNGVSLGTRGDLVFGDSSVWNTSLCFSVPQGLLAPVNDISIQIRGVYEAGLMKTPYLVDSRTERIRLFMLAFLNSLAPWVLIGVSFVTGTIILVAGFLSPDRSVSRILVGAVCFLTGGILLDFPTIEFLPIDYLAFKKIPTAIRHIHAGLFVFVALALLKKKPGKFEFIFVAIQAACAALVVFLPGNVVDLKRLYTYTYITALPLQPYLLYLVFRYSGDGRDFAVVLFGASVTTISSTLDLFNMIFIPSNPFISHFGISVLMICVIVFVVRDLLSQYRSLVAERKRSAAFLEESMRDPLTEAFNRNILPSIAEGLSGTYSAMYVDLDDFKTINDTFGHAAGDEVLRHVVATMRGHLRAKDFVIRMGGDEFAAVLPDCPSRKAMEHAQRVVSAAAAAKIPWDSGAGISYTLSVGVAGASADSGAVLQSVLERADAAAYTAKRAGKNRAAEEAPAR